MLDCGQSWYCNQFQITVERCIPSPSPLTRGYQICCRIQYFFIRDDGSVSGSQILPARPEGPSCACPHRQHFSGLLHQPSGGSEVQSFIQIGPGSGDSTPRWWLSSYGRTLVRLRSIYLQLMRQLTVHYGSLSHSQLLSDWMQWCIYNTQHL